MIRSVIVLGLVVCVGCSGEPDPNAVDRGSSSDVADGGIVENADREKAEAYFVALGKVQSAEEEKKLLVDFAEWLEKNEYKIQVEVKDEKYVLSCPYFPPVTPWTDHAFLDAKNLELLPRIDDGG